MDNLQREIGEWQDRTFPAKTVESIVCHMEKEFNELRDAFNSLNSNPCSTVETLLHGVAKFEKELADVFILSFGLAHHIGISAEKIVREKFEINKMRQWGNPDENGVVEHIREESNGQ